MKKKSVLITGGSGLLAVNWALSIRDEYEITLLLHQRKIYLNGVKTDIANISSLDECKVVLDRHKPDVVIHMAGLTSVEECEENPNLAQFCCSGPKVALKSLKPKKKNRRKLNFKIVSFHKKKCT